MTKKLKWLPKAFLFDFEGTLVTFEWKLKSGVTSALKEIESNGYSLGPFDDNPTYVDIHNFVSAIKEKENNSTILNKINDIFDVFDADALTRWSLNKGAKDTLNALKVNKFPIGLITNVGRTAIQKFIDTHRIENFFDIIITRNDVEQLKPNPEGLIKASSILKINPNTVLFTGDSYDDLGAAQSSGMKSCYILGGQDYIEIDYPNKPFITIQSLDELIQFI